MLSALKCKNYRQNQVQDLKNVIQPSLDPLAVNATYVVWIKSESYYDQITGLASSADCCLVKTIQLLNMLACKSGYYCAMCTESGTTASLNRNEPVIK